MENHDPTMPTASDEKKDHQHTDVKMETKPDAKQDVKPEVGKADVKPAEKAQETYFLSSVIGSGVYMDTKRIGKLSDLAMVEQGKIPEVTHILVMRPFGDPTLVVPWPEVSSFDRGHIKLRHCQLTDYEGEPTKSMVLLKDHVMDKKVIDIDGREVDVVYDIKMTLRAGKLFVTEADFSKSGLLRRMGLWKLAQYVYRKEAETTPWTYIQPLPKGIGSFKGDLHLNILKERLADLPPVDLADILEELTHEQRVELFSQLEPQQAKETLEEADPTVQRDIVSSLKKEKVARIIKDMTPGQAADFLAVLPVSDANSILAMLNPETAKKIETILAREEERTSNFATTSYLKVPPDISVAEARSEYKRLSKDTKVVMYLYVVNLYDVLLGVIDLRDLLNADDNAQVHEIMTENVVTLPANSTLLEATEAFDHYGFRAIPVVDEENKILGVVPYRDIMELTHHFMK